MCPLSKMVHLRNYWVALAYNHLVPLLSFLATSNMHPQQMQATHEPIIIVIIVKYSLNYSFNWIVIFHFSEPDAAASLSLENLSHPSLHFAKNNMQMYCK